MKKLDTDAIKEIMDDAVVLCYPDKIEIAVRLSHTVYVENIPYYYFNLVDMYVQDVELGQEQGIFTVIRPGDKAIFTTIGGEEKIQTFQGFSMDYNFPFAGDGNTWGNIKPLPKNNLEKTKLLTRIEKMESHLKNTNNELARMKKQAEKM